MPMKGFLLAGLAAGALVLCASIVAGADKAADPAADKAREERQTKAKAAAAAWCDALLKGEGDKVTALSATPFSWDGKDVLETPEELEVEIKKVIKSKGARELKSDGATVASDKRETVDDCVPNDRIVVKLTVKDESVLVCVRPGTEFKVVGFKD
jgi:hypothetical protein